MFYKLQNIVDYEDHLSHIFYSNACETGAGNLFLFSYYLRLFLYLNVDHSIFFSVVLSVVQFISTELVSSK